MKRIVIAIVILLGTLSSLAGLVLIRFSKSMEAWEMAWDDENEQQ